jgi:hypothetical protein
VAVTGFYNSNLFRNLLVVATGNHTLKTALVLWYGPLSPYLSS